MSSEMKINYPENLPDTLQMTKSAFEKEAKMAMAAKLFEMKKISSGMAASLLGIERVSFLLNLKNYNVPMIDLEYDELYMDLENA